MDLVNDAPDLALLDHLVEVWSWVVYDFGSMRSPMLVHTLFNDVAKLSHSRCKSFHSPEGDCLDGVSRRHADEPGFRQHFRLHDAKERNRQASDSRSVRLRRLCDVIRLISEPIGLLRPPVVVIGHVVRLVSMVVVRFVSMVVVVYRPVSVVVRFVSMVVVYRPVSVVVGFMSKVVIVEKIVVCDVV